MIKKHINKVDYLRGVAILLVISFHILYFIYPDYSRTTYSKSGILEIENTRSFILNFNPISQGWIGVVLFLVISGFLIHLIYLQNSITYKWKEFFSKRFWRIYPLYFLVLLFFIINRYDSSTQIFKDVSTHLFLTHNLTDNTFFSINPSFWTIALEVQLYLLYPILIFMVKKMNIDITLFLLFLLTVLICLIHFIFRINSPAFGAFFMLKYWFVWTSGAWLADRYFHNKRIFNRPFLAFLLFYFLFFVFKYFLFTNYLILIPASFACIAFLEFVLHRSFSNRFVVNRSIKKFLKFTGVCSYSIYLIHQPFLGNLFRFYIVDAPNQYANILISVFFTFSTIFLISYSLYQLFELPSISMGERIRKKGRFFF